MTSSEGSNDACLQKLMQGLKITSQNYAVAWLERPNPTLPGTTSIQRFVYARDSKSVVPEDFPDVKKFCGVDIEHRVPVSMQNKLFDLLDENPDGILMTEFNDYFEKKYGVPIDFMDYQAYDVCDFVSVLPNVFRKVMVKKGQDVRLFDARKGKTEYETFLESILYDMTPLDVKRQLRELLKEGRKKNPHIGGIYARDFLKLWKKKFGTLFDHSNYHLKNLTTFFELQRGSVLEMYEHDREIVLVEVPEVEQPTEPLEKEFYLTYLQRLDRSEFPEDSFTPHQPLPSLDVRTEFKVGARVLVYVKNFYHENKQFYIVPQKNADAMDNLLYQMTDYYKDNDNLKMPEWAAVSGVFCAAHYRDKMWYRVQIDRPTSVNAVRVFYVDDGYIWNVNKRNLRYLHKDFSVLPCQAALAELAPTNISWDNKSVLELVALSGGDEVFAEIIEVLENKIIVKLIVDGEDITHTVFKNKMKREQALNSSNKDNSQEKSSYEVTTPECLTDPEDNAPFDSKSYTLSPDNSQRELLPIRDNVEIAAEVSASADTTRLDEKLVHIPWPLLSDFSNQKHFSSCVEEQKRNQKSNQEMQPSEKLGKGPYFEFFYESSENRCAPSFAGRANYEIQECLSPLKVNCLEAPDLKSLKLNDSCKIKGPEPPDGNNLFQFAEDSIKHKPMGPRQYMKHFGLKFLPLRCLFPDPITFFRSTYTYHYNQFYYNPLARRRLPQHEPHIWQALTENPGTNLYNNFQGDIASSPKSNVSFKKDRVHLLDYDALLLDESGIADCKSVKKLVMQINIKDKLMKMVPLNGRSYLVLQQTIGIYTLFRDYDECLERMKFCGRGNVELMKISHHQYPELYEELLQLNKNWITNGEIYLMPVEELGRFLYVLNVTSPAFIGSIAKETFQYVRPPAKSKWT